MTGTEMARDREELCRILHDANTGKICPDDSDPTRYGAMADAVLERLGGPLPPPPVRPAEPVGTSLPCPSCQHPGPHFPSTERGEDNRRLHLCAGCGIELILQGVRDVNGHDWRETFAKHLFPQVCRRCMSRSDDPAADRPCDALTERAAS